MNAAAATPRYLALGDSYTIGEGVAAGERWPAQLARELRERGLAIGDPEIVAQTGWTTDELAAAIAAHRFTPPYELVTLLIGVNNQYRGRALDNYREEFAALLALALAFAGDDARRVIVVSIPDWGVTRFAHEHGHDAIRVGAHIDTFNTAARAIAAARDVVFVDVTAASRKAGARDGMLVDDGLHPSAAQYALWTAAIAPVARAALGHAVPR